MKNPTSLLEALSQLWTKIGPTAPWKASNATFIYSVLLPTLNTFLHSLLAAILGLPEDPTTTSAAEDILTAASPITNLAVSFISSSLSALLLSPIDTARTLLILTPRSHGPRSLYRALRLLPSPNYFIPSHLIPITILHSSLPSLMALSTPLLLKSYLTIDPVLNPASWSFFTFISSGLELGIRFPLETVLRRAQIATFTSPSLRQNSLVRKPTTPSGPRKQKKEDGDRTGEIETIIPTPQTYRGIAGTMWSIVYEEGDRYMSSGEDQARTLLGKQESMSSKNRRPGQGLAGLYRGWRIGFWGLAGAWGSGYMVAAMGGGDDDIGSTTAGFPRGTACAF